MRAGGRGGQGLSMKFKETSISESFSVCAAEAFIVHSPDDLPTYFDYKDHSTMNFGAFTEVLITPQMIESDDDLRNVPFTVRQCYFEHEFELKYFNTYTRQNCLSECISDHVQLHLDCVPFHFIREFWTDICPRSLVLMASGIVQGTINNGTCDFCLPTCNQISYKFETRIIRIDGDFDANL